MSTILITGATAGFGEAIAWIFAEHHWNIILCGRRCDRLEKLEKEITSLYNVKVYSACFDIRNQSEVVKAVKGIPHDLKNIDVLVNNAGLASGLSTIQEGSLDDWETMIDTNIKGLLYISREIMPLMIARGKGHIVNMGSIAGKEAYSRGNVYCGTKHAVDAISKSMRIDLLTHGIRVTAIHPGAAETEFSLVRFKGDTEKASAVYTGYEPLKARDIAEVVYFAVSRPPHVCLNDIIITPTAQANTAYFHKKTNP